MSKKKSKVHPKRIFWMISPVTRVSKDKKKYDRKSKYKNKFSDLLDK